MTTMTLLVLTIIIMCAALLAALYLLSRLGEVELELFDEKEARAATVEAKAQLSRQFAEEKAANATLSQALLEECASNIELLHLNHRMGVATLQAETERAQVQKELSRLHQRLYRQPERKSPLNIPISAN